MIYLRQWNFWQAHEDEQPESIYTHKDCELSVNIDKTQV